MDSEWRKKATLFLLDGARATACAGSESVSKLADVAEEDIHTARRQSQLKKKQACRPLGSNSFSGNACQTGALRDDLQRSVTT